MAGQLRHFDSTMLGLVFLLGTSLRFSKYIDRSFNTNIYIYTNISWLYVIHTSSIVYCTFRSGTECVGFLQYLRFRPHNFKRKNCQYSAALESRLLLKCDMADVISQSNWTSYILIPNLQLKFSAPLTIAIDGESWRFQRSTQMYSGHGDSEQGIFTVA